MAFISFDAPIDPDDRAVGREPPPGRDLAERLLAGVQAVGFRIVEPIGQHDSYGWCFTVHTDPRPVWCMLQLSDEWLLITQSRLPLFYGGWGVRESHSNTRGSTLLSSPCYLRSRTCRMSVGFVPRRTSDKGARANREGRHCPTCG